MNKDVSIEGSFSGYQRDRIFYNPDGAGEDARRFFEAGWLFGLDDDHDGRCVVPVDVDGDGDLDLAVLALQGLRLYENRSPPAHFVRIRLVATSDSTKGLGAIVRLTAGGVTQSDHAKVLDGFQSQVPSDLHFGLGTTETVESVRVEWPSGHVQEWAELPVDRLVVLTEGRAEPEVRTIPRWPEASPARRRADPAAALAGWLAEGPDGPMDDVVRVVRWMDGTPANEALAAPTELVEASREHDDVQWILVAPDSVEDTLLERSAAELPERFRLVRADARQVELTFGEGEVQVRPSTLVFRGGGLRRSFHRRVELPELASLLRSLEDEPPFPELLVWDARRLLDEGAPREALRLFEQASEIDPHLAPAFEGLGRCYVVLGEFALAEEAYARSVQADPDYAVGHYNLAVSRSQLGRFEEALEPFREALRVQGEHLPTLLAYGETALHAGEPLLALESFQRATRSAPSSPAAFHLEGKMLGQLGRFEEAVRSLEQCLALDPHNEDARRALELARSIANEG